MQDGLEGYVTGLLMLLYPPLYIPVLVLAVVIAPSWWEALLNALALTVLLPLATCSLWRGTD